MKDNKVVLNVGRGFPAEEGFLAFNKQSGKEAAHCWAKPNLHNNAFTLIELLVVVLIIGILAAVALPQYKVAVAKSRAAQMLVRMDALKKAGNVFFIATGTWTEDVRNLDIDILGNGQYDTIMDPFTSHGTIGIVWSEDEKCVIYRVSNDASRRGVGCINKDIRLTQEEGKNNLRQCMALTELGDKICGSWSSKGPVKTYDNGLHRWEID